jgi:hypothetical protein
MNASSFSEFEKKYYEEYKRRLSALKNERKLKVKLKIQNKCRTNFFRD